MRRAGPLQELPLDHFLPSKSTAPQKSNKRPHSPGVPSLFSPAKRRILTAEGIFSPEKTMKSSLVASRANTSPLLVLRGGADSPARKLDFGPPKSSPRTSVVSARKASNPRTPGPSPPLRQSTSSSTRASESPEADDYFSPRHPSRVPTAIPRQMPPPPDRQSQHYPGFDVFQDTHIRLLRSSDLENAAQSDSDAELDAPKENVPPRRRSRKSATAPAASAEMFGIGKGTPATPKKKVVPVSERDRPVTPTPRRLAPSMTHLTPGFGLNLTPGLAGSPSQKQKAAGRQLLEDEVDEVGGSEDEDQAMVLA